MAANIDIRLARDRVVKEICSTENVPNLIIPGEVITSDVGFMRFVKVFLNIRTLSSI